ncbi:DNA cytosine methyltransferase [Pumilibacter intestinalis]|uniref:DNA cytosine methyltransferase n=1 Tax=Pumilibacter intestinalis TaxID=2941511 RepID=UPI00203E6C63|nr:DNA (cytosine-5-)-methyltransferase [Pumilibacter intestinalis]
MLKLATVFSGIGAIESALDYMNINPKIIFACDNGERNINISNAEIDKMLIDKSDDEKKIIIEELYRKTGKANLVKETYFANYDIGQYQWYEDIRFINGLPYKNIVDLFVGGSPCQSFSLNGKRAGFSDIRGTLFYEFIRLINEIKPKVFIYENVRGMLVHNNGETWQTIKKSMLALDYDINIEDNNTFNLPILNAKDYGIPQNRERIFIVGFRKDLKINCFEFPKPIQLKSTVFDYLERNVEAKYYLGKKGFEFVTTHPSRARVGAEIMGCQKANQQFNWNGDFIFEPFEQIKDRIDILKRAYVGEWNNKRGVCRKFTPRECLRLMGFKDTFKIIHKDEVMYRQAGNSIVVNVLMCLVDAIIRTGVWDID